MYIKNGTDKVHVSKKYILTFFYAKLTNLAYKLYLFDEFSMLFVNKSLQIVLVEFHFNAEQLRHCIIKSKKYVKYIKNKKQFLKHKKGYLKLYCFFKSYNLYEQLKSFIILRFSKTMVNNQMCT